MADVKSRPLWDEIAAPKTAKAGMPRWMLSFVDLTGILVAFFVLMFSMQTLDRDAWHEMSGSLRAAFNPRDGVVQVVPEGTANALQVVGSRRDVLPYLDILLRGKLAKDMAWKELRGKMVPGLVPEMVYDVPSGLWDIEKADNAAAWRRLGDGLRGWKNPLTVRVSVGEGADAVQAAALANVLAGRLVQVGAVTVAGEVVSGNMAQVQIVVRGE